MKKNSKLEMLTTETPPTWSDTLEEHPLIHWLTANGKTLLYILLGLILFVILAYRFMLSSPSASEAEFIQAEKNFLIFANPETKDSVAQTDSLKALNSTLSAHPELHAKYDGLIAETLLTRGDLSKAQEYALPAIKRTSKENDPFYTVYAKNTLLVEEQKYPEALEASRTLKEQMIKQGEDLESTPEKIPYGTLLYALNLLRIGMLQQQLQLKTDELVTWEEWKDLTRKSRNGTLPTYLDGQIFLSFDRLLAEGDATFTDYIDTREKLLKN